MAIETKASIKHPDACNQCGTCVEVCPVEMVGGHAIVTFLANPDATDYSVWLCSSCWRCHESCPSGVDIYGIMMEARRNETAPAWYQASFERILVSGLSLHITQAELDEMRAGWGLETVRLASPDLAHRLLQDND